MLLLVWLCAIIRALRPAFGLLGTTLDCWVRAWNNMRPCSGASLESLMFAGECKKPATLVWLYEIYILVIAWWLNDLPVYLINMSSSRFGPGYTGFLQGASVP